VRKEIYEILSRLSTIDFREPFSIPDGHFLSIWTEHYHRILRLIPSTAKKVLEIGVGYGALALAVKTILQLQVVATEHPSRGYLWSKEYRSALCGVDLVAHSLSEGLPFQDQAFDLVLYCDILEHHQPNQLPGQLAEIRRVLMRRGYLILSTPNLARLPNRIEFFLGGNINPPLFPRKIGETSDHVREYTEDELRGLLAHHCFSVASADYGLIPYCNKRWNAINKSLFPARRNFGDEMYLLASLR
jgi:SAM-dependent methyltransferase